MMLLSNLGYAHLRGEQIPSAHACFVAALQLAQNPENRQQIALGLAGLGAVEAAEGKAARGARLLGTAAALRGDGSPKREAVDQSEWERAVDACVAALGEEAFALNFAEGGAMTWEQALAFARDS